MVKFLQFLKRIYLPLIFIILLALTINFYAGSSPYTRVKLVTTSNKVTGGVYSRITAVNNYIHLRSENRELAAELADALNRIEYISGQFPLAEIPADSVSLAAIEGSGRGYHYHAARVRNNTINRQQNYITLDKGRAAGLEPNMAVISNGGIVGYVADCIEKFSVCISVLNTDFRTSGKIKGSDYAGTVLWDGKSWERVILTEVPKYARIQPGDTIVTTEFSDRFPPGIMIGTVQDFELVNATYYEIRVKLRANLATLGNVLIVSNPEAEEIKALQEKVMNQ